MGGAVSVSVSDTWLRALSEDKTTVVWTVAMAGAYPPEAATVAKQVADMDGVVFKMEKVAVVKALHLAILYASRSRQPESSIILIGDNEKIRLEMDIPDVAELRDTIPGEVDKDTTIQLNPQYLLDATNQIESDIINLKVIEEKRTIVITDEADANWVVVQAGMYGGEERAEKPISQPISEEEILEMEDMEDDADF